MSFSDWIQAHCLLLCARAHLFLRIDLNEEEESEKKNFCRIIRFTNKQANENVRHLEQHCYTVQRVYVHFSC